MACPPSQHRAEGLRAPTPRFTCSHLSSASEPPAALAVSLSLQLYLLQNVIEVDSYAGQPLRAAPFPKRVRVGPLRVFMELGSSFLFIAE